MVSTVSKVPTRRCATASCLLRMSPATLEALREKALPKGDALALAQVAGIQAAKWTPHLIPLCHALEARHLEVTFDFEAEGIRVRSQVETIASTGPEMEALVACTIAGLALYDMCKSVDRGMSLEAVHLEAKSGGKSDHRSGEYAGRRVILLTLSDRASQGIYEDKSGPVAAEALRQAGFEIQVQEIIPDEQAQVAARIKGLCDSLHPDLLLTLGSTGLSPRDIAPEALRQVIEREVPGFPELFRVQSYAQYPASSFLSRGAAGLRGRTFIANLPGRPTAVAEGLALLIPALKHVFQMIRGDGHE